MSFIRLAGFIVDSIEREQRRKQSRCELCGNDRGSELILLEEWRYRSKRDMIVAGDNQGVAKRLIYRSDEAREKINPEKPKQCPTCGATDIKYAYIEDGTMGYWCYQCKKSLKAMKGQLYTRWHPYDREFYIVCPSCAVTDIPSPPAAIQIQIPKAAKSVIVKLSFVMFLSLLLYLFMAHTNKKITQKDRRFVSSSNGIVLDSKTGLEWYAGPDKDTSAVKAKSWIEDLNRSEFANGYWRMPTIEELKTLYQKGAGSRNMTPLLKTTGWWVWSCQESTEKGYIFSHTIHFRQCTDDTRSQNRDNYKFGRVFAVRSKFGSTKKVEIILADGRFTAYSNGIVLDTKTGLEWYAGPDRVTTGIEAESWVEDLNRNEFANGYWRMPTIEELKTLYQKGVGSRNMTPLLKTTGWLVWSGEVEKEVEVGDPKITILYVRSLHFSRCQEWHPQEDAIVSFGRAFAVRSKNRIAAGLGSTKEIGTRSEIRGHKEFSRDSFFLPPDFYHTIPNGAKPVRFNFKGIVRSIDDSEKSDLNKYFSTGDTFSGSYVFDAMTKDGDEANNKGWYHKPYFDHPDSFLVVFDKDPVNLIFKLKVPMKGWNVDSISTFFDWPYYNYHISAGLEGNKVGRLYISQFSWHTYFPTKDDSLPIYPPALNKDHGGFSFQPCSSQGGQCPVVHFQLTSLSLEKLYSTDEMSKSGD